MYIYGKLYMGPSRPKIQPRLYFIGHWSLQQFLTAKKEPIKIFLLIEEKLQLTEHDSSKGI